MKPRTSMAAPEAGPPESTPLPKQDQSLPPLEVGGDEIVPVLLVDDQPANLEALQASLESTGCRFVSARSADEALLALLDQDFAAIVLDVRMPGMTGLELAGLIKQRKRTRHVPILFLTAHMLDQGDVLRGYTVGAVDYLTKPIRPEILRSKLAVFIDLFRKNQAVARANEALQREIAVRQEAEEALRLANQDLEARVRERTQNLSDADRRKDEFLAALAHELRNPLAALRTASEVFRIKSPPGLGLDMPQGIFDRQLRQMTRLIDDLLDVSRITRNMLMLRKEKIELHRIIAAAVETARPAIEYKEHTLDVELPEAPVEFVADPVRLSQVFANLLDNAAKYTEEGGHIRLSAAVEENRVIVRVTDTGLGMEPEVLSRVFELFMQAHSAPGLGHGGLGIGLTLVRRLVEMHGGTVIARSEGSGKGTEIEVSLPLIHEQADAANGMKTTPEPAALEQTLRILIVDDNRDAAEALNVMLSAWGQTTRVAYDALTAIDVAGKFQPDVVLLDIGLPKLHGYDVARRLREQPWGRQALLVAVTGWGQEADRQQSKAAGINHHLIKPVDPDVLRKLLAEHRPPERAAHP
jgi:signal transduction histidine kinase